jgi:hypothetical protein
VAVTADPGSKALTEETSASLRFTPLFVRIAVGGEG